MLRWVRDIMLGELAGGSLILPHHGSEFTASSLALRQGQRHGCFCELR